MAQFMQSRFEALDYPRNLVTTTTHGYGLQALADQLNKQEYRLFCEDPKASVDFVERYPSDIGTSQRLRYYTGSLSNQSL